MPTYVVEIDGKRYRIQGDRPPSEEEARAAVSTFQPSPTEPAAEQGMSALPIAAGAIAGMKAAPGVVSMLHKGATVAKPVAAALAEKFGPAAVAGSLAGGHVAGAAGAVAASQAPKALGVLQRLTAPLKGTLPNGAIYTMRSGAAGPLSKAAGVMSSAASDVAPALGILSLIYDTWKGAPPTGVLPMNTPGLRK